MSSPTPLRRSRSITRKDKDKNSPVRVLANPDLLFDLCVKYILDSNELAGKAVVNLPQSHAQYLLCLGLKKLREGRLSDNSILHSLITGWAHSDLSFNFRSNQLVIRRLGSLQPVGHSWSFGCLEPHVYHSITGVSKSRYSSCAREISIGLFNHVYRHDQVAGSGSKVFLRSVDLSDFEQFSSEPGTSFIETESPVTPFYHLARGTFPGRDAYQCLSPDDFKFYRTKKPTLQRSSAEPIKLYVNFKFTTVNHVMEFTRLPKGPTRYKLCLKALDIASIEDSPMLTKQLDQLNTTEMATLITRSSVSLSENFLRNVSSLWVLQDDKDNTSVVRQALKVSGTLKNLFISLLLDSSPSLLEAITETSTNGHGLQGLALFRGENKRSLVALGGSLTKLSSSLRYLQLYDWAPSNVPLKPLSACHQLRVISIVVDCSHLFYSSASQSHTIGELFETLGHIKKLEFIELGEQVDLHAPDLVRIQKVLRHSLTLLEHCHLNFNYISLKRADLDDTFNQSIYQLIRSFFMIMGRGTSLLYRQTENFHLSLKSPALSLTKRWLSDIRRNVCFKIGAETNSASSLVHLRRLGM
ncbi:PREDICTED: uncharacterized protein LOC109582281 [Amphimedon queenslandica]|uniref:Uncharacterized protein n=1 Tax=Amphimedon queenslandica TaxID=400682 RepID=A0A1X7USW4_AMPQE|nr:PREDICTED: uncharacterized protein LOC109582281 [Amphimedon queenslandica]|eukprot:XP_019852508.1 PREDICTED: uncharacterized protein LOC109582281 [Amphimedon queenslandica]